MGNVDYMASVGARLRPHMTVRWSEERNPPEADDIYLFQRLISLKNYHINLGNVDYMASVGARLRQHMTVRGSEERNPPEADDIYLFQILISLHLHQR